MMAARTDVLVLLLFAGSIAWAYWRSHRHAKDNPAEAEAEDEAQELAGGDLLTAPSAPSPEVDLDAILPSHLRSRVIKGSDDSLLKKRYILCEKIGMGATGVVYRAHRRSADHDIGTKAAAALDKHPNQWTSERGTKELAVKDQKDQSFAIKVISLALFDSQEVKDETLKECVQEFSLLLRIDHPNIIRVEEVLVCPHHWCIVMELAPGSDIMEDLLEQQLDVTPTRKVKTIARTPARQQGAAGGAGDDAVALPLSPRLKNRVSLRPVSPLGSNHRGADSPTAGIVIACAYEEEVAADIMRSVVSALCYIHGTGIVHRDIKPDNIIRNPVDGSVKLVDFGASRRCTIRKALSSQVGATPFMAPEVLSSTELYGMEADIWSLGVTLFIMVTGAHPFDDGTTGLEEMLQHMKSGNLLWPPGFPDALSPDLIDVLTRMLKAKPTDRISAPQLAHHRWLCGPGSETGLSVGETTPKKKAFSARAGRAASYMPPLPDHRSDSSGPGSIGKRTNETRERSSSVVHSQWSDQQSDKDIDSGISSPSAEIPSFVSTRPRSRRPSWRGLSEGNSLPTSQHSTPPPSSVNLVGTTAIDDTPFITNTTTD